MPTNYSWTFKTIPAPPQYTIAGLGTLGGTFSSAGGINDAGHVVGIASTVGDAATHAFLYQNGTMMDLGTLGGTYTDAWDINAVGQVVGYSYRVGSTWPPHAFLYQNATMFDLNELLVNGSGWTLMSAAAINAHGQIAGWGRNALGQYEGFLLTPVPLPGAQ